MEPDSEPPADDRIDPDDPAFDAIAEAILDGRAVDWQAVASGPAREYLEELRLLQQFADVHRELPTPPGSPSSATPRPPPAEPIGQWGRLLLLDRIGAGAFGEVFRAWDPDLEREVALKLLYPSQTPGGSVDDAAIAEGRLLARIRHPNVVTVFGAERTDDRVGIWTEFVHGSTLASIVADSGPMGVDEAIAIGMDVCRALSAVHEAGLVHGDVKAQNVLRERGGRIVLVDLGTGREHLHEVSSAASREISGTPLYMAPELWQSREPTPGSDLYSLGVLLYFLVTGTFPVRGTAAEDIRQAHADGQHISLGQERPDLPSRFTAVIDRALDPDPLQRFASAERFRDALEMVAPAAVRRRRVRAGVLVGGSTVVVVGLLLLLAGVFPLPWRGSVEVRPVQLTFQPVEQPATAAAISADGKLLAYAALSELIVLTIETGDSYRVPLPEAVTDIVDLAWIPHSPEVIVATRHGLWKTSTPGRNARRIADIGGHVSVSHDGGRLAVRDIVTPRILVMTTEGLDARVIVPEAPDVRVGRPAWSPDDARIAFSRQSYQDLPIRRSILSCRPDGSDRRVVLEVTSIHFLVWTADGRIVYSTAQQGGGRYTNLWQVHVNAATGEARGESTRLPHPPNFTFATPSLSHDGTRMAFVANQVVSRVMVAEFDENGLVLGQPRQVSSTSRSERPLAWAPAGDELLFVASRAGHLDLYRQPLDRREARLLFSRSQNAGEYGAFSPDGHRIFFPTAREPWRLMRAPAAGGDPEPFFDLTTWNARIRCAFPPASLCAVGEQPMTARVSDTIALTSFDPNRGPLRRYGNLPGDASSWDISPTGTELAYIDHSATGVLRLIDVLTGQQSSVSSAALDTFQFIAATRDGKGWLVSKVGPDRSGRVFHLDRAGRMKVLWESPHMQLGSPLISPDGRRVAFAAGWNESNVWMIRDF